MSGSDTGSRCARAEIWIVGESADQRQSLSQLVEALGHNPSGFEDLAAARLQPTGQPDIILFAGEQEGSQEIAAAVELHELWPETPVVLLWTQPTVPLAVEAMRRGLSGVLQTPLSPAMLQQEIEALLEHSSCSRPSWHERVQARQKFQALTPRRQDILRLIVDGLPNKVIASRLNLGLRTVEKERAALFEDLGVQSAAQAAVIIVRADLPDQLPAHQLRGPTKRFATSESH